MRISSGILDPELSDEEVMNILDERCKARGLTPDWNTLTIEVPRVDALIGTVIAT